MNRTRLTKELKDVEADEKASGVSCALVNNDIYHWRGTLKGPADTVYAGGVFNVDIKIPQNYPFEPPKMRFETKVWHPNVSSANGAICLDILKDEWSPALSMRTALLSLQALLCEPNPSDPQDAIVAKQFLGNRQAFNRQAKQWTEQYAAPRDDSANIQLIISMGFTASQAQSALNSCAGNVESAVNCLLSG
jgi:ubiquitin-conjugating enzyme (huntingtin interacting protein 2)